MIHAGHNGLLDIQNSIGDNKFSRLRFGIGNDFNKGQQANYVLSEFSSTEEQEISESINLAVTIIEAFSFLELKEYV